MFSHKEKQIDSIEIYLVIIVLKWGLNSLFILPKSKHYISFLIALLSNKFRIVCEVDGSLQLDSRDWSMY